MSRSGIVNVRMVITEEKILSNIDKVQKLINPNNKKQIIQLEEDAFFKDLIESIKTYLIEYPKQKNFPHKMCIRDRYWYSAQSTAGNAYCANFQRRLHGLRPRVQQALRASCGDFLIL